MMYRERLVLLRKEKGLTQKGVAEATDLSWRTIQDIELGKNPGYKTILKLADLFNMSIDYMAGRTDDRRLHK